jgi:hypothetical protein
MVIPVLYTSGLLDTKAGSPSECVKAGMPAPAFTKD